MKTRKGITCGLMAVSLLVLSLFLGQEGFAMTVQVSGTKQELNGVAYGNGTFVAVGDAGTILTSPSGTTWVSRLSGTAQNLMGVTYAGGTFVVVGDAGTILTSPDGKVWTSRKTGATQSLNGVAYGNGTFVAVGFGSTVVTSTDGATWKSTASGSGSMYGLAYGNGTFVAGTSNYGVTTSPDGATWTYQGVTPGVVYGVAYAAGTFVAGGINGAIITSPDGKVWTSRTTGTGDTFLGVAYGGGAFLAAGTDGAAYTSPDGTTWTSHAPATPQNLWGAAYGNGTFVAVGTTGAIVTSSYAVTGSVFDIATGKSIPNVAVTLADSQNKAVATALTDTSGHFSASVFSAGTYSVVNASRHLWWMNSPSQVTLVTDASPAAGPVAVYLAVTQGVQSIPLSAGWNFISTPVQPPNTAIATVLADIFPNLAAVWAWSGGNQNWQLFIPSAASGNTLTTFKSGVGYWVYMNAADFLCIAGSAGSSSMALYQGWNLVGFNGPNNQTLSSALAGSVSAYWQVVWTWDGTKWYTTDSTGTPFSFSPITNFTQKAAYWIYMSQAASWVQ